MRDFKIGEEYVRLVVNVFLLCLIEIINGKLIYFIVRKFVEFYLFYFELFDFF